jgi:hypothetical protein
MASQSTLIPTVDSFVAEKASNFNEFQQTSISAPPAIDV